MVCTVSSSKWVLYFFLELYNNVQLGMCYTIFFLLIVLLNLSKCQMPEFNKCDQELLVVFIGLRFHIKYDIS